tara:strand:+ start:323 stop:541 length:219 start_codon:yes stop_codon:yes gene_type:complete
MGELSGDLGKIGLVPPQWRIHAGYDGSTYAATQRPCIGIKIVTMEHHLADARDCFAALHNCTSYGIVFIRDS